MAPPRPLLVDAGPAASTLVGTPAPGTWTTQTHTLEDMIINTHTHIFNKAYVGVSGYFHGYCYDPDGISKLL